MKNRFFVVAVMLAVIVWLGACGGKEEGEKSSSKDITKFTVLCKDWDFGSGSGNSEANAILISPPADAGEEYFATKTSALSSLTFTIELSHSKATVDPASGTSRNFSGGNTHLLTVTAEDGSKKYYKATAQVQ